MSSPDNTVRLTKVKPSLTYHNIHLDILCEPIWAFRKGGGGDHLNSRMQHSGAKKYVFLRVLKRTRWLSGYCGLYIPALIDMWKIVLPYFTYLDYSCEIMSTA